MIFTCHSPLVRTITNLFKHNEVTIAFKSINTIYKLTRPKTNSIIHEHMKSGIYKFTRAMRKVSSIGQTSYSLQQRYQDHMRYIKQNGSQLAYAVPSLDNNHEYEPITTTMSLLKQVTETALLICYEPFYIQSCCNHKKLIPEQNAGKNNSMYQLIFDPHIRSPLECNFDQYSDFLDLSTELTLLTTRLFPPLVCTINIALLQLQLILCDTVLYFLHFNMHLTIFYIVKTRHIYAFMYFYITFICSIITVIIILVYLLHPIYNTH